MTEKPDTRTDDERDRDEREQLRHALFDEPEHEIDPETGEPLARFGLLGD